MSGVVPKKKRGGLANLLKGRKKAKAALVGIDSLASS